MVVKCLSAWISSALLKLRPGKAVYYFSLAKPVYWKRFWYLCKHCSALKEWEGEISWVPWKFSGTQGFCWTILIFMHSFRLQPVLRLKSFYPLQGWILVCVTRNKQKKRIFLCSLHTLLFLIKKTCLSCLEASWLLVGIGVGILNITSIMCVHLQPVSTCLLWNMCSEDISAEGYEFLRQWNNVALYRRGGTHLSWTGPGSVRLGGRLCCFHMHTQVMSFCLWRGRMQWIHRLMIQWQHSLLATYHAMKWSLLYEILFFPQEFK